MLTRSSAAGIKIAIGLFAIIILLAIYKRTLTYYTFMRPVYYFAMHITIILAVVVIAIVILFLLLDYFTDSGSGGNHI